MTILKLPSSVLVPPTSPVVPGPRIQSDSSGFYRGFMLIYLSKMVFSHGFPHFATFTTRGRLSIPLTNILWKSHRITILISSIATCSCFADLPSRNFSPLWRISRNDVEFACPFAPDIEQPHINGQFLGAPTQSHFASVFLDLTPTIVVVKFLCNAMACWGCPPLRSRFNTFGAKSF